MRALQRSLELLGDKLYIKHTPILHQEGLGMHMLIPAIAHIL